MKQIKLSKKGQFFIAGAILIIAVVTIIFQYTSRLEGESTGIEALETGNLAVFVNNVQVNYNKVVELSLSEVSWGKFGDPEAALTANLSEYTLLLKNITTQKGISSNISTQVNFADATYMNATISISLISPTGTYNSNFNAVKRINLSTLALDTPPYCTVVMYVFKEYYEPVIKLNASHFDISIDGIPATCTYEDGGTPGEYVATCEPICSPGQPVETEVIDHRNIYASEVYAIP